MHYNQYQRKQPLWSQLNNKQGMPIHDLRIGMTLGMPSFGTLVHPVCDRNHPHTVPFLQAITCGKMASRP
jgi:hypothetical protein